MVMILLTTVFVVMRVLPGNPVELRFEKTADPALIASFTHQLGLDKPLYAQYLDYLWGLLHGNLGTSMAGEFEPVAPQIVQRFPATLELTTYAFIVAVIVGVVVGSFGARKGGAPDEGVKVFGILIYAFPVFFLGMLLQLTFGIWFHILPVSGRLSPGVIPTSPKIGLWNGTGFFTIDSLLTGNLREFVDAVAHLILPALALGLVISGVFVRMTRTNMLETMRTDFVTAARARGLKEKTVVYAYALRNAMLPIVTIMGLQFALLLSGAILTETEFNILGVGTYLVDRVNFRDYTAVQGTVVFLAVLISMVSLVVDILRLPGPESATMKRSTQRTQPLSIMHTALSPLLRKGHGRALMLFGVSIVAIMTVMSIAAPVLSPHDPTQIGLGPVNSEPSAKYPLGTDQYGRDLLSRTIWGGRFILLVAVTAVLICMAIGVPIGLVSAYTGGNVDRTVSLVMDSIYAFPSLVLAIMIISVFGVTIINEAMAIAVVYIPSYFRVIRSQVLAVKELPYVDAARSVGAGVRSVLLKYIWPNVISSVIVVATVNFADSILTTAGLDFIGLGLPVTLPDWGIDLSYGRQNLPSGAWWTIAFSGLMILLAALGFSLISEGYAERTNPKLR